MDALGSTTIHRGRMRRLPPDYYRGTAIVHWSMTVAQRRTGWLTPLFHARFREVHLHALSRFSLVSLVYCLMPDHLHLLWAGLACESDQNRGVRFFRAHLNRLLAGSGCSLQKQAWDLVLLGKDVERGAVEELARYIVENPVRSGLAANSHDWPHSGCQAPGYPDLDWRDETFRERLWKVYHRETERRLKTTGTLTRSAPPPLERKP